MEQLARWTKGAGTRRKLILVGWEEGAELGVMGLTQPGMDNLVRGGVVISLQARGDRTSVGPYLPAAAGPLYFIFSSADSEGLTSAKRLFGDAREPKEYNVIDARDREFDGNRAGLFGTLADAIRWIGQQSH